MSIAQGTVKQTFSFTEIMRAEMQSSEYDKKVYERIILEVFSVRTGQENKYSINSIYGAEITDAINAFKAKQPIIASRALFSATQDQLELTSFIQLGLLLVASTAVIGIVTTLLHYL